MWDDLPTMWAAWWGIMNADQYCDILEGGLVESFEKLEMPEGEKMFQQDNVPKHTSKKATK